MTVGVPEKVLVVDDEPDVIDLVTANLSLDGYDVYSARDGAEAMSVAREVQPDCILLDVMMPKVDGYEACRALRADPTTRGAAILMLTAKFRSADKLEGFSSGADDYILKPFDIRELQARVAMSVGRRRALRETSPLTGLPGNSAVSRELDRRLAEEPQWFALVHADLHDFKSYNDRFGFARGDVALAFTADVLRDVATSAARGAFLGHIGGDDFVLVCSPEDVLDVCRRAVDAFDSGVGSLYGDDERPADGRLLSMAVGAVDSSSTTFTSAAEAAAAATDMKNEAKCRPGFGSNFALATPALS